MSDSRGRVYEIPTGGDVASLKLPNLERPFHLGLQRRLDPLSIRWKLRRYNSVVSLVIMREVEGSQQLLVGIRTAHNQTHPDVVSVPTAVYGLGGASVISRSLREDTVASVPDKYTAIFSGKERSFERTRAAYSTNLGLLATHMLGIKLGLGGDVEPLVTAGARFRYHNLRLGASLIDHDVEKGVDIVEAVAMLNIGVTIPQGFGDMFTGSSDLRDLTWVGTDDFLRGYEKRRAQIIFGGGLGDIDEVDTCVHGLCLSTTVTALRSNEAPS